MYLINGSSAKNGLSERHSGILPAASSRATLAFAGDAGHPGQGTLKGQAKGGLPLLASAPEDVDQTQEASQLPAG